MKSSKSRRCYIIASANSDTREIQELLRKEGIRPYEKPLINYRTTMFAQVIDIIGESDFVVALVSLKGSQQNVLFEIGVAHGLGKPIFLVIQGEGPIPSDLSNFVYVRSSADADSTGLSLHQFLNKCNPQSEKSSFILGTTEPHEELVHVIGRYRRKGSEYSSDKFQVYGAEGKREKTRSSNGFRAKELGHYGNRLLIVRKSASILEKDNPSELEITSFLVDLFEAEGAVVSQYHKHREKGADMALWIDSLATSLGNPILVEMKIGHITESHLTSAGQDLGRYLQATNLQSGLLLYLDYHRKHFSRSIVGSPLVIRLDINDLVHRLANESLVRILLSERNAMVHLGE